METKKSKVINATYKKSFESKGVTFYEHELEFENGDRGKYISKEMNQNKFVQNQEADYTKEIKENNGYTNIIIKPVTKNSDFGGGKPSFHKSGNEAFAMSYAKDVLIASWTGVNSPKALTSDELFTLANRMYEWLESKKK